MTFRVEGGGRSHKAPVTLAETLGVWCPDALKKEVAGGETELGESVGMNSGGFSWNSSANVKLWKSRNLDVNFLARVQNRVSVIW